MRSHLAAAVFFAASALVVMSARPSEAQGATQFYPYCGRTSGAVSCYYNSITECRKSSEFGMCESNPQYIGGDDASAQGHGGDYASARGHRNPARGHHNRVHRGSRSN